MKGLSEVPAAVQVENATRGVATFFAENKLSETPLVLVTGKDAESLFEDPPYHGRPYPTRGSRHNNCFHPLPIAPHKKLGHIFFGVLHTAVFVLKIEDPLIR